MAVLMPDLVLGFPGRYDTFVDFSTVNVSRKRLTPTVILNPKRPRSEIQNNKERTILLRAGDTKIAASI